MGEKVEIIIAGNEKPMNIVWDARHTVFTIEQGMFLCWTITERLRCK